MNSAPISCCDFPRGFSAQIFRAELSERIWGSDSRTGLAPIWHPGANLPERATFAERRAVT